MLVRCGQRRSDAGVARRRPDDDVSVHTLEARRKPGCLQTGQAMGLCSVDAGDHEPHADSNPRSGLQTAVWH